MILQKDLLVILTVDIGRNNMKANDIKLMYLESLMKNVIHQLYGDGPIDEDQLVETIFEICQELWIKYPDKDINIERKSQTLLSINNILQKMR
jgi:hypothetical protein